MLPAWRMSSRSAQWLMTGFARRIGLRIAEARRIPAPVRLDEDEQLTAVAGGVDQRQAETRDRAARGQHSLEQGTSSHATPPYRYRYR